MYRYFDNGSKDGFTEVINLKTKFKNQGKITGSAYFKYDYTNGRYYDKNGVPDRLNLFDEKRKEIQATQTSVEPEIEEFEYDDLPF